jgi:hypothetical protein
MAFRVNTTRTVRCLTFRILLVWLQRDKTGTPIEIWLLFGLHIKSDRPNLVVFALDGNEDSVEGIRVIDSG